MTEKKESQSIIFPGHIKYGSKQDKNFGASNYLTAANCYNSVSHIYRYQVFAGSACNMYCWYVIATGYYIKMFPEQEHIHKIYFKH